MGEPTHCAALLRQAARMHPDREAYVHGDKRATYAWLDRVADGFAATLAGLGATSGDVVCLMLPSSIKFAGCYLGALRAGAITSAINGRLAWTSGAASSSGRIPSSPSSATVHRSPRVRRRVV